MHLLLSFIIHTANVLGIFNDPFEFEGDYGKELNPIRQKVFEILVEQEAISKNLTDAQIKELLQESSLDHSTINQARLLFIEQSITRDLNYGPTFAELIPPDLIQEFVSIQKQLNDPNFTNEDLQLLLNFVEKYKNQKVFSLVRKNPPEYLNLDKVLRDQAAREGKNLDLPIVGSPFPLDGKNSFELKRNLLHTLFTRKNFQLPQTKQKLNPDFLQTLYGLEVNSKEVALLNSKTGRIFFYWIYEALNLHLISEDENLIQKVNLVKDQFTNTLGNAKLRAHLFKEKVMQANSAVVFTQECDLFTSLALTEDGSFLPVDQQNPHDGCFIFLKNDQWEPHYEMIPIENYAGFHEGKLNVVIATHKQTGEKFLLASCHGDSLKAEDGRLQISLIMDQFHRLSQIPEYQGLQLLIGIDANTKSTKDVSLLREHLDSLGLTATNVGPTTVKKRMVTVQHTKAAKIAIDEEDYLITLKADGGGRYEFTHYTIGFQEELPDPSQTLPNLNNPSDHYSVGASVTPLNLLPL